MNMVQFAHGVLSVADDHGNRFYSEPLPSFNPRVDELPENPFADRLVAGEMSVGDGDGAQDSGSADSSAAVATQKEEPTTDGLESKEELKADSTKDPATKKTAAKA
jgi:hypothetical protein